MQIPDDVPDKTLKSGDVAAVARVLASSNAAPTLDELRLVYARTVLELERGHVTRAAQRLGVSRFRLARILAKLEAA